jgi:predicted ATP-binding protein involved in virulence
MYVEWLNIINLRCFKHAILELRRPTEPDQSDVRLPNVNLFLGKNGSGKTTILKALALSVLSPIIDASGYVPYYLVRRPLRKSQEAEVMVTIDAHEAERLAGAGDSQENWLFAMIAAIGTGEKLFTPLSIGLKSAQHQQRVFLDDKSRAFFMLGYGATRRVESPETIQARSRKRRSARYQRVSTLFEDYLELRSLSLWLPQLEHDRPKRFKEVIGLIDALLPGDTHCVGKLDNEEMLFSHRGVELPFGALSDGYRAYIGLIGDMLYHMHEVCPTGELLTDVTGLVMVDDVDLQLHPSWQRQVVPKLATTFPKLQFVLTTHSPLVAGTLHYWNIFIMDTDENGDWIVRQLTDPVHGLSADQILVSPYFDMLTTRAPEAVLELQRLSERAWEGDTQASVDFLRKLADGFEQERARQRPERPVRKPRKP